MKKHRNIDKGDNLFSVIEHQQMMSNEIVGILKLRDLIDWELFRSTIETVTGYTKKDCKRQKVIPYAACSFTAILGASFAGVSSSGAWVFSALKTCSR